MRRVRLTATNIWKNLLKSSYEEWAVIQNMYGSIRIVTQKLEWWVFMKQIYNDWTYWPELYYQNSQLLHSENVNDQKDITFSYNQNQDDILSTHSNYSLINMSIHS